MAGWGRTKPPPGAGISWGHPLADRLLWAVAPGPDNFRDLIDGQQGTLLSTGTLTGQTGIGQALDSPDTTNGGASWPWTDRFTQLTTKWTVLVWAVPMADGFSHFIDIPYRATGWTTPFQGLGFAYDNTVDRLFLNFAVNSTTSDGRDSGNGSLTALGLTELAQWVVTRNDTLVRFYRNAVQIGTDQTLPSNNAVDLSGKQPIALLNHSSTSLGESLQGRSPFAAIWARPLAREELATMLVEPYAMVLPYVRRLWVPPPPGETITPAAMSIGLSAPAPILQGPIAPAAMSIGISAPAPQVGTPASNAFEQAVLDDTPKVGWCFGAATDILAFVGGLTATKNGTPTTTPGPVAGKLALRFPTVADFYRVIHTALLNLGDGPYALEAILARDVDSGGYQIAATKDTGAYNLGIAGSPNDDKYMAGKVGITTFAVSSNSAPADGTFHHQLYSKAAGTGAGRSHMFIDGVDRTVEQDTAQSLVDNTLDLLIGKEGTTPFGGAVAYFIIYGHEVSAARALAHYRAMQAVTPAPMAIGLAMPAPAIALNILSPAPMAIGISAPAPNLVLNKVIPSPMSIGISAPAPGVGLFTVPPMYLGPPDPVMPAMSIGLTMPAPTFVEATAVGVPIVPVRATFEQTIRRAHTRIARVSLLNADLTVAQVFTGADGVVVDGSVSTDADRRRSCQLVIANPDGAWTPTSPADPFFLNRLFKVERGIMLNGAPLYFGLGIFLIDRPVVTVGEAGATLQVSGQDRIKLALKSRFTKPVRYDAGMSVASVVRAIAADAGMGTLLYRLDDGGKSLLVDRILDTGADRWPAILNLAADNALQVYVDAEGYLVLEPALTADTLPASVWTFERGAEALMLGVTKELNDEGWFNHTLVSGEGADLPPVMAEARDLNPASPGYNPPDGSGPIGDRVDVFTSAGIRSVEQAQEVADARLLKLALVEEAITVPSVVHPGLKAGDVVTIVEPLSRVSDDYLIDTLVMPLGAGSMTLTSRKVRSLAA